mmetsp:Transcript_3363/g.5753  ORF Transcript_3363/g.5753 Transcript_3363/m.5753 type:complete len:99 (-) Transcript_3363:122-418(-)
MHNFPLVARLLTPSIAVPSPICNKIKSVYTSKPQALAHTRTHAHTHKHVCKRILCMHMHLCMWCEYKGATQVLVQDASLHPKAEPVHANKNTQLLCVR